MSKPGEAIKNQRGRVLLAGAEKHNLPITIQTVLIDGKRMATAFYRQLAEKPIIDATTGEIDGIPLGYFHIHTKECLEAKHIHLLWGKGTQLHLATITDLQDDQRYQAQARLSKQRNRHLIDVLVLSLASAGEHYTLEWKHEGGHKVSIATYTLYVENELYELLGKLTSARSVLAQELERWQSQKTSPQEEKVSRVWETARIEAERLFQQLQEQAIEVAYPEQFRGDSDYPYPSFYWNEYPVNQPENPPTQLYWRSNGSYPEESDKQLVPTLEGILTTPMAVQLLRLFLMETHVSKLVQTLRSRAEKLAESPELVPLLQKKETHTAADGEVGSAKSEKLNEAHIWACYQQELNRFKKVTTRWETFITQVAALDQLFLL